MIELLQQFAEPWALRALAASCMVGVMCGVLGCFIVLRNMALIGDALSHAILPGVVLAFILVGQSALGFFGGAVFAGLLSAFFITWIQLNVKTKGDAAIGIVFTAMFSLGVIGISRISRLPGVHLDLKDFLFGNVLGVGNDDLYLTLVITLYVLASVVVFYRYLFITTFQPVIAETMGISVKAIHYFLMLLLSFAVVAALQTVGVILVVAMLITPAATALLLSNRLEKVLILAAMLGLFAALFGLLAAIVLETPPGPAMAVMATLFYLVAAFFSPSKGLVFKFFNQRSLRNKIRQEDTLKQLYHLSLVDTMSMENLLQSLGFTAPQLKAQLRLLHDKGMLEISTMQLSESGKEEAKRLVRAHRLWETYLAKEVGLSEEQIHDDAEKLEHLLTDEMLEEVDKTLGYPTKDPHGSPIPARKGLPEKALLQMTIGSIAQIAKNQPGETISAKLWKLGIPPEIPFKVVKKGEKHIDIEIAGKMIIVPVDLARKIQIHYLDNNVK